MDRERRIAILTQVRDSNTACDATEEEITLLRVRSLISGPDSISSTIGLDESGKLPHLPEGQTSKYSITKRGLADIDAAPGK